MDLLLNPVVLALILVFIVRYMVSCAVHPFSTCEACNRSKESRSKAYRGAFGPCRSCRGRGHTLRFGARVLGRKI